MDLRLSNLLIYCWYVTECIKFFSKFPPAAIQLHFKNPFGLTNFRNPLIQINQNDNPTSYLGEFFLISLIFSLELY